MQERIEKRRKIAQIKTYLSSMKKTTKKPYHSGMTRPQIDREYRNRAKTRVEPNPDISWWRKILF